MRFIWFLFLSVFFLFLLTGQQTLHAQETPDFRLTANYEQRLLTDILTELEQGYSLTFSYLANTLGDKIIDRNFKDAAWPEVENYLFKHTGIQAKTLSGGYVVLTTLPPGTPVDWEICVRLTDEHGAELPFVTSALNNGEQSFYSDNDGWCRRKITARPADSLTFYFLGYQQLRVAVSDAAGAQCPILALQPSGIELTSIEVIEYLTDGVTSSLEGREVIVQPSRLSALPGFTEKEVYRSAQLLPGINSPDESAGKLSIRGGAPDQTHVLWDGINVYASGHYFGMISFFSPNLVDEMRIWRGQAEASYGGRLSGVVEMNTSRKIIDRPEVGATINLTHVDAYVKFPIIKGKSDLHVSARTSLTGPFDNPTYQSFQRQVFQNTSLNTLSFGSVDISVNDSLESTNQAFNFTELNARWQWNPDRQTSVTISGFLQSDVFANEVTFEQIEIDLATSEAISTRNNGLSASLKRQLPGGSNIGLQVSHSDYRNENFTAFELDIQGFENSFEDGRESTISDFTVKADYFRPVGQQSSIKAGLQFQRLNSAFSYSEAGSDEEFDAQQEPFNGDNAVAYGTYTIQPFKAWRAKIGMRLQYYAPNNVVYAEPRLTTSYQLSKNLLLKAGYGENHQFFNEIIELDFDQLSGVTPLWVLADGEDILVSGAQEATVGALWQKKGWLIDVEAYHKRISNLSSLNLLSSTDPGDTFFSGASRAIGADLLVKKRWKNFSSWAIYSLSKTDWRFTEISDNFFPAANDRRHQLKWVNSFETNHWLFSLGWQYRTGNRFSPAVATDIIVTTERLEPENIQREGLNAGALPAFHRLDLSAFYQWGAKPGTKGLYGKIGLSLLNVYNRKNARSRVFRYQEVEPQQPPFGGDHRTFFVSSIENFGLRFTPNLSVFFGWK
ncbi:MAG: outer membrane cobalamin receptor [Neolewinella sp.]|jgi:outer membrane cobalamin receptor